VQEDGSRAREGRTEKRGKLVCVRGAFASSSAGKGGIGGMARRETSCGNRKSRIALKGDSGSQGRKIGDQGRVEKEKGAPIYGHAEACPYRLR